MCWFRIIVEETTEILGERDYYLLHRGLEDSTHVGKEHVRYIA